MMRLPETQNLQFKRALLNFEKEKNMPMLRDIEELALEKGLQEGIQTGRQRGVEEGLRTAILDLLALRFDPIPASFADELQQISHVDWLRQLLAAAAQVDSLDAFASELMTRFSDTPSRFPRSSGSFSPHGCQGTS